MIDVRIEKWEKDLDQLAVSLPDKHKNLFYKMKSDSFHKKIARLKRNLDKLDNMEILVNLCKIVAAARDAHTAVLFPAREFLPFRVYWFQEGIYILAAADGHADLVNCRISGINGMPVDQAVKLLKKVISHENELFFQSQLPDYLCAADILYGLEVIDETNEVELDLTGMDGNSFRAVVSSVSSSAYHDIPADAGSDNEKALYRRNRGKPYWSALIDDDKTLYFNYNSCKENSAGDLAVFTDTIMSQIENTDVARLILDLRNNRGGNSTLLESFIDRIEKCKKINQEGGLYVVIGRDTFSSALLNAFAIKNKTKAIFIGEPTGGKPNCYGEVQYFKLNNSKVEIRYSTKYYKLITNDRILSLYPDVELLPAFRDYFENRDPCLDYILAQSRNP